jgi:uncharacterized ferredoxin-like protein
MEIIERIAEEMVLAARTAPKARGLDKLELKVLTGEEIKLLSAVSVAMDHRVDNRIMYSAGKAAIEAGLFGPEVKIAYGIPLSATGKNPFFDR